MDREIRNNIMINGNKIVDQLIKMLGKEIKMK